MHSNYNSNLFAGSRILFGSLLLLGVCYGQFTFPDVVNPHGQDQCATCHFEQGDPTKSNFNPEACITCHSRDAVNNKIHQLNNLDINATGISIPKEFPLTSASQFDCITCHTVTCKTDRANQTFLRGGPYKTELDFCFACHQKDVLQQTNPHIQIQANGSTDESTCLHCHLQVPDVNVESHENNNMRLDMTPTCNKCHALHRHETQHLDVPINSNNIQIMSTLAGTEKNFNITFPLSANKTIQCNTCHYTHQRGVLGQEEVVFIGPLDNQWRLRLSKEQLCLACHDI